MGSTIRLRANATSRLLTSAMDIKYSKVISGSLFHISIYTLYKTYLNSIVEPRSLRSAATLLLLSYTFYTVDKTTSLLCTIYEIVT